MITIAMLLARMIAFPNQGLMGSGFPSRREWYVSVEPRDPLKRKGAQVRLVLAGIVLAAVACAAGVQAAQTKPSAEDGTVH